MNTIATLLVLTAKRDTFALLLFVGASLLFFMALAVPPLLAQAPINLQRDKDKTVYTIGSDNRTRQEEAAEREKAWDMLKNMGVVVDQRKRQPAESQSGQSGPDR